MGIDFGYVLIGSVLIFTAGWFWFDHRLAKQAFEESPAGRFRARVLAAAGELPRWITDIAADADGAVYGYGYPPDLNDNGWETDRECMLIGTDAEAKEFWRESATAV